MANENRPPRHGPDNCNNGLSGGQILLIILACLLVIGLIAALIAWLMQSKNKNKSNSRQNIVQIGGLVPQNNIQQPQNAQNQPTLNTNQPAAPVMQNNVVQPFTQNNPVPVDTTINQQELISNVVTAATPQIMASMAQIAAQEADMEKKKEETEKKKEEITNNKSDDNNLQEPKTEEKKSEDIDDEEEKGQQKLEQSDLENLGLKAFAGRLTNPFEQLPMEKEVDNINCLKEQREQEQAQQKNDGNNIAAETPKFDFASLLGLPTKQNEQKKMDNMTCSQEMPQTINFGNISRTCSPEMKAVGGIDMLNRNANIFTPDTSIQTMNNNQGLPIMTQNKSTEPISQKEDNNMMPPLFNFMPPAQNDNQTINKEKHTMNIQQLPNNMMAFNAPKEPIATTKMPSSIMQPNQIDNIPLANNEPVELFNGNKLTGEKNKNATSNNMMPFIMPEQNKQENNLSNTIMPSPMMTSPIMKDNVNYNGPLNANMMSPISPNAVPNKQVMSGNSMFNKPEPINEDEIKPDAPIFTPPMMKMADNNEPKMQEEMKPPFILQSSKEKSDIEELPIPMQVNAQNKEQDKNSKEANESSVVNPFMQPAQPSPNVPVKKENNNPMFSTLPGDGKQMEANNGQSQMNLGTQNKCTCSLCSSGGGN